MSSKWSDRLVTNFLKAYEQHPCLWNPYHKDYYNCYEKNEALRKIIDTLSTPGLTVTDYLQQIKIIREKYKQEQIRAIKCMQSQKQYRPSFTWYNIVAEMLKKVINDEEKANSRTTFSIENHDMPSVLKSLSNDNVRDSQRKEKVGTETETIRIRPCTNATCDEIIRRSKSVGRHRRPTVNRNYENRSNARIRYVPCPKFRKKTSVSKDKEENMLLCYKPTRDIEKHPVVGARLTTPLSTKENDRSFEPSFLQCPTCGWETANYNQIERNAGMSTHDQRSYVPCSSYIRDPSRNYTLCTGCDQVTRDENIDPNIKKYINNSGDFEFLQDLTKQVPRSSVTNRGVETAAIRSPVKKIVDSGVQCEEEPEKLSKNGTSANVPVQTQIKFDSVAANKLQGGIVEACLKIILSGSRGNLKENVTPSVSQTTREVQCNRSESKSKETQASPKTMNEAGINTVNYSEVGIQNTVCTSDGTACCVLSQTDEEEKRRDKSTVQRTASKEVTVDMVDTATKGVQRSVCVSRANLFRSRSTDRTEIGTTTSAHQVRSVACITTESSKKYRLECVQTISDERNVTRTRSQGSINYCVRDTCPRNIMSFIKEDPTITLMLQKLLYNVLSSKSEQGAHSAKSSSSDLQTDNDYSCRLKGKCTIDVTEMMNKIKGYAIRTLGSDASDFDKSEVKELHQKFDASTSSQEVQGKPTSNTKTESTLYASTLTMTDEDKAQKISENDTELVKGNESLPSVDKKRLPSVDKEVSTYSSTKDACTMSFELKRDVQIQSCSELLKGFVCPDKCKQTMENRVSVGTQKRDPILVRVIKCTENQAIVRSDKQTLTTRNDLGMRDRSINKRVETCGRPTCIAYNINKKSNESSLEFAFRKKCENVIDNAYHKRSIIYNNYICDENCKDSANNDWTNVTNLTVCSNNQNSKIPMCVRSRKYDCK